MRLVTKCTFGFRNHFHQSIRPNERDIVYQISSRVKKISFVSGVAAFFDDANGSCNFQSFNKKKRSDLNIFIKASRCIRIYILDKLVVFRSFFSSRMLIELHLSKSRSKVCSSLTWKITLSGKKESTRVNWITWKSAIEMYVINAIDFSMRRILRFLVVLTSC